MGIAEWIALIAKAASIAPTLVADITSLWNTVSHFYSPTDQKAVDAELAKARSGADSAVGEAHTALTKAGQK